MEAILGLYLNNMQIGSHFPLLSIASRPPTSWTKTLGNHRAYLIGLWGEGQASSIAQVLSITSLCTSRELEQWTGAVSEPSLLNCPATENGLQSYQMFEHNLWYHLTKDLPAVVWKTLRSPQFLWTRLPSVNIERKIPRKMCAREIIPIFKCIGYLVIFQGSIFTFKQRGFSMKHDTWLMGYLFHEK